MSAPAPDVTAWTFGCSCGWEARANSAEGMNIAIRRHMEEVHGARNPSPAEEDLANLRAEIALLRRRLASLEEFQARTERRHEGDDERAAGDDW